MFEVSSGVVIIWVIGCAYLILKGLSMLQTSVIHPEASVAKTLGYVGFGFSILVVILALVLLCNGYDDVTIRYTQTDDQIRTSAILNAQADRAMADVNAAAAAMTR